MAKWDLSKLPEGRKPLDDAWFAERAQMQDRIKELEGKLVKFRILASTMAEAIEDQIDIGDASMDEEIAVEIYRTTLAELTGGNDE